MKILILTILLSVLSFVILSHQCIHGCSEGNYLHVCSNGHKFWCHHQHRCQSPPCSEIDKDTTTDNRIFIARRPLKPLKFKKGVLSHSGLLVRHEGDYYLIEYMNDGQVHKRLIPEENVLEDSFLIGEQKWSKQETGKPIDVESAQQIVKAMREFTNSQQYDFLKHNCHMAQEGARYLLGFVDSQDLDYEREVIQHIFRNQ